MKKLAVVILSLCIIAMPFSNSMNMFSLEKGKVCIEEYNLKHFLQYSSLNFSNSTREYNKLFPLNGNYSHHHVIPLNSFFNNDSDIISSTLNKTIKTTPHSSKSWNSSFAAISSSYHSRHKSSPPLIPSIPQQNSILLI